MFLYKNLKSVPNWECEFKSRQRYQLNTKDNFFVVSIGIVRKFFSSVCRQISSANDKDLFFWSSASASRLKILALLGVPVQVRPRLPLILNNYV